MYVLGIDTSTMTGGVALLKDDELVGESVLNIRTTHSERLLPALETLLADGGIEAQELDLLSVVTGPAHWCGYSQGFKLCSRDTRRRCDNPRGLWVAV